MLHMVSHHYFTEHILRHNLDVPSVPNTIWPLLLFPSEQKGSLETANKLLIFIALVAVGLDAQHYCKFHCSTLLVTIILILE